MKKGVIAIATIGVLVVVVTGLVLQRRARTRSECVGVPLPPGQRIDRVVDRHDPGMTFCLSAGTYRVPASIEPKDGHSLIGAGMDSTFLEGTGATIIIDADGAANVAVSHMDISGARGSDRCKPQCGTGFFGGTNSIIDSVRFHDNRNHGIGGSNRLLVRNSLLDHNGSPEFLGCCAGGIKGGSGFTIVDSRVFSNTGVGIWCDAGCTGGLTASGNNVYDNTRDGIRYEVSSAGAIIDGNTVQNNNTSGSVGGHGGITNVASQNATIMDNVLGGNKHGGIVIVDSRRGDSEDVVVKHNELNGDDVKGCSRDVVCRDNK